MKKWFTNKVKFWEIMKICGAQAILAMIIVGVSMAHHSDGQLLETKISLDLKNVPFEKVLKEIEKAGKVKFVYSLDQLGFNGPVTLSAVDLTLGDLLDKLFEPYQIKYKVHEKELTITLKKQPDRQGFREVDITSPIGTITGQVTDVAGQSLAGVNVIIKGTTSGTSTDAEGKFSIQANDEDYLVFSFIGFLPLEARVSGRTVIDVVLQEDTKKLNEVVVNAGYWTVKEKEQTGNIARITADEIRTQPVSNPLQAMAGRMAGVVISQETGVAGGGIQVQIRGKNSISSGNDPLYIVDGIPVISNSLKSVSIGATLTAGSPFSTINPNDIESIEVLKDGAATAIYGSRAANGVILITTKKGVAGKTKVDITFSKGISHVTNMMNVLTTNDYLMMRHEGFKNDNIIPSNTNAYDLLLYDTTRYTNWQKQLIGNNASTTNLNAAVSGGDKNTQFLFGGGYYSETTVFPGDFGFKRLSGNLSLNHRTIDEKFRVSVSVNYQSETNRLASSDLTNQSLVEVPNAPEIYVNGKLNWGPSNFFNNPYANLLKKYNVDTRNFRTNALLSYSLTKDLQLKTNLGYTDIQTGTYASSPIASFNPKQGITTGQANFGTGENESWIVEPQLEYSKHMIGNHEINVLLGATFQESVRNSSSIRGSGYINDQLLDNLQAAATITVTEASTTEYRYQAFFGRVNYKIKQRYIFDLVGRRDGSSRFGPNNRFATFGSISSAWIFSQENFIKNSLVFLSYGKLRVSYGTSGNDQIGDYAFLDTYSTAPVAYQGVTPLYPTRLANPNYSWETNRKIEGGLELGFLEDRFSLNISYYQNRSSNQLVGQPVSGVTGFTTVQANLPATVENSGLEIEFSSTNISKAGFTWTSALNLTVPRNKLIEFKNLEISTYANRFVIGQPITIDKVYAYTGIDSQTGLYQFRDVDGNGVISTPVDNQVIINTAPTLFGGINNTIKYGNWTLNFFFQFVQQKGLSYFNNFSLPGLIRNQPVEVMDRWNSTDDVSTVQKFSTNVGPVYNVFQNALRSELYYDDASFLRLKNVSVYYQLPKAWIEKVSMQSAEVFIQGQNLLTFTKYKGLDPETRSYLTLPTLRTITIGLRVTF